MNKLQRHQELCDEIHNTYMHKNSDYGDSFGKSFEEFGVISSLTRMSDKWNRLKTLANSKHKVMVADESIKDTLLDLSNYCLMLHMELENAEENYNRSVEEYESEN